MLTFSDQITNSSAPGLSEEGARPDPSVRGWGWRLEMASGFHPEDPFTSFIRFPGSGAHISWVALSQSRWSSCSHLGGGYSKHAALKVLSHDTIRMVVELGRSVAVPIFLVFFRASVDIGNAVLIPGFGMKRDFCFSSGVLEFFCLYGSDISQIGNFACVHSLLPSDRLPVALSVWNSLFFRFRALHFLCCYSF